MFGGDPNDPNGDVQKLLGCSGVLVLAVIIAVIAAIWRII